MRTEDFDYYLPENLIAQHPSDKRDESRLMVLDKKTGEIEDTFFWYYRLSKRGRLPGYERY